MSVRMVKEESNLKKAISGIMCASMGIFWNTFIFQYISLRNFVVINILLIIF